MRAIATTVLLAATYSLGAAAADTQIVKGVCEKESHTAEGAIGEDLTKRQSQFYCDAAAITFFTDYKGHLMVQFSQKESHRSPILAFSGKTDEAGIMMQVDRVYFSPGAPVAVSAGSCKFFFKNPHLSGIFCGAMVDERGRRTTAIVAFEAAPGQ